MLFYVISMFMASFRLDLIERVPEELWTEVCDIVQEAGIKTIPKKKNCKKAKWLSEEALQIALKEEKQKAKEKRKDKKGFLSDQCKEIEEKNRMGKTRDLLNLAIPRENFMQRWAP